MPIWEIHCFNGVVYRCHSHDIGKAVKEFCTKTRLHVMDIKYIKNLH